MLRGLLLTRVEIFGRLRSTSHGATSLSASSRGNLRLERLISSAPQFGWRKFNKKRPHNPRVISGKSSIKSNKFIELWIFSDKSKALSKTCYEYLKLNRDYSSVLSKPIFHQNSACSSLSSFKEIHQPKLLSLYFSTSTRLLSSPYNSVSSRLPNGEQMSGFSTKIVSRFVSTMRKNSTGSGEPIQGDQDNLIANVKCNKRVKINACGELYSKLSETKPSLYKAAPGKVGINFDVDYFDSLDLIPVDVQANNQGQPPVVCILHGTPGHYKDFSQLISYLTGKGVRVIAPNFPNYSATYEFSFRHSPLERVDYLRNLFDAIQLRHIDMLIAHSSAVYTLFELLNQILPTCRLSNKGKAQVLTVKSIGLLNTPSYDLPSNMAVTPFRLFTLKLFDYPFLRPFIVALIHLFVKVQGIQNRVDATKIENLLIAASAVGYSDSHNMPDHLKLIRTYQIPTFLLVGCNDKLLPMRCYEQLKRDLGITSSRQVKHYDSQGKLRKNIEEPNDLVFVSQFDAGGHYTFQKHWNEVCQDVHSFLLKALATPTNVSTKL